MDGPSPMGVSISPTRSCSVVIEYVLGLRGVVISASVSVLHTRLFIKFARPRLLLWEQLIRCLLASLRTFQS